MKHYQTLLFDVDDTLLDFGAAERQAFQLLLNELGIPCTTTIAERYHSINHGLWASFEQGKMAREEVLNTRFSLLFMEYGQTVDGAYMEQRYRSYLEQGHQLVEGAYELIVKLQPHYNLYIVTNGVFQTQDKRLRDSGLYPYFENIFVSEVTGYQKPMREYFDYVFARIPAFDVEQALLIGDSLTADMKGGQLAGLDTCWFNPEQKSNTIDIDPTYEIQRLEELHSILNGCTTR